VRTAAIVVSWKGGPLAMIVVVDNASGPEERRRLTDTYGGRTDVRLLFLDENRQFAGGLNAGAATALAAGAERLLLLNNDTVLAPHALRALTAALDGAPRAGVAGPLVVDRDRPDHVLSAGERHGVALLCVPRTLLRHRRRGTRPYAVGGVMGCAMLVTRACFEAVGGFAEEIEVYYEDVDFCLAARARGFDLVLAPAAVVEHDGMRGFAAGLTPWAAFLKARNPWLVVRRHGGIGAWLVFVPTYAALLAGSAALWGLRGRGDVVGALLRGAAAGLAIAGGRAPAPAGAPRPG
jgi:GT2 family glycosyltransferase